MMRAGGREMRTGKIEIPEPWYHMTKADIYRHENGGLLTFSVRGTRKHTHLNGVCSMEVLKINFALGRAAAKLIYSFHAVYNMRCAYILCPNLD